MALGDGIRRNIATVSKEERERFWKAFRKLDDQTDPTMLYGDGVTFWDKQEAVHKAAHAGLQDVHGGPAFFAWHRQLINMLEELLRKADPLLSLHYWDWTTDPRNQTDENGNPLNLMDHTFFGDDGHEHVNQVPGDGGGDVGIPFQDFETSEGGGHNFIWRNVLTGLPVVASDHDIIHSTDGLAHANQFPVFDNALQGAHNYIHSSYIRGTIFDAHFSFHDPFVFLLHSNVDRLWAMWQRMPGESWRLDPNQTYGTDDTSDSSINKPLGPWDGSEGLYPWNAAGGEIQVKTSKDSSLIIPASYDTAPHSSYIVTQRDTFSTYELETTLVYPESFQVIYDGFTPNEIGLPGAAPAISFLDAPNGTAILSVSALNPPAVDVENPGSPDTPQRITFTFGVSFIGNSAFPVLPAETRDIYLKATLAGDVSIAPIRLTNQPNPYMIDIQGGNPAWLSTDVRVFQLKPGEKVHPSSVTTMGDPGMDPNAPYIFIQSLLGEFHLSGNSPTSPFENISRDEQASQLELSRTVKVGSADIPVFNFAVAKVRYRAASQPATDVRVFFRTFNTMVSALDYHPDTNYRRRVDGNIPLPGLIGSEVASIPYFAQARVDSASQIDDTNKKTITASGGESLMYFGCWLDFNQPSAQVDTPGGPASIMQLIRGIHQCMVAEIRFQPGTTDPIIIGATPSSSDHLAQRNLAIIESDNPGVASTHVVQHTLLVKPSAVFKERTEFNLDAVANVQAFYDELVIRWNNLPRDTTATLFFPEWNVDEVLLLASSLRQGPKLLKKVDANTLECSVTDICYIPIPGNNIKPYAGLITLQLPQGVKDGQLFKVDIQQHSGFTIETKFKERGNGKDKKSKETVYSISKRKVLGALRLTIPVKMGTGLLKREIRNLAVLRYIAQAIPVNDRWYPIFTRYIGQIADKVRGLGIDPTLIKPSPDDPGIPGTHEAADEHCISGKVCEIFYDCFGDFEGFVLDNCAGTHLFKSREKAIGEIALRACKERLLISICVDEKAHHKISKIIIRC